MLAHQHLRDGKKRELPEGAEACHQSEGQRAPARRHDTANRAYGDRDAGAAEAEANQRLPQKHAGRADDQRARQQARRVDPGAEHGDLPGTDPVGKRAEKGR